MTVRPASEATDATITDDDRARIDAILSFWFKEHELSAPQIDHRMDIWFGQDPVFDHEIEKNFSADVEMASQAELGHWTREPRGRLALIILLDQFRRNIYRNSPQAFEKDSVALKLCVEGAMENADTSLSPIQRVFFYMPLQHAESRKVQAKSVELFGRLAEAVSATMRETFLTVAQFAELHRDIVDRFGRFPHRNKLLGRDNTAEESEFLADDDP